MHRFVTILGGACTLLWLNSAWAAGGFTASCWDIDINGTGLEAECRTNNGGSALTGINLNNRIGNRNGKLVWESNGGYGGSSTNCEIDQESGRSFLHCDTMRNDGSWTSPSLNLDDRIANRNGNLRYSSR